MREDFGAREEESNDRVSDIDTRAMEVDAGLYHAIVAKKDGTCREGYLETVNLLGLCVRGHVSVVILDGSELAYLFEPALQYRDIDYFKGRFGVFN